MIPRASGRSGPEPRAVRYRMLITLAALTLFATGCGGSDGTLESVATNHDAGAAPAEAAAADSEPVEVPTVDLPDTVATTASGSSIEFASLSGQDLLLWFWAPW